jgi:hypothetical protein
MAGKAQSKAEVQVAVCRHRNKVERVEDPNALFARAIRKCLEDKPLGKLGALSRFDKLKAPSLPRGLSNGLLHPRCRVRTPCCCIA